MTSDSEWFQTAVSGVDGTWPSPPYFWSYSSLREAEECPRRWMLSRATYPGVWEHSGYLPRPTLAALVGNVAHHVLEVILRALQVSNCNSIADPRAVEVLRALGGYSKLVEQAIKGELERIGDNPRIAQQIPGIRTALQTRVPDIRRRVQAVVARTTLESSSRRDAENGDTSQRGSLVEGSHPEVRLRVPELRFEGRADLLTIGRGRCVITDYKTGLPDDHHTDQLRTYALLWSRDLELNPSNLPVERLVLSYETHDEIIDAPTDAQLNVLAAHLNARIVEAENELQLRPPPARPSPLMCSRCTVRHLCGAYWDNLLESPTAPNPADVVDFVDHQAVVVGRNGPRSWIVELEPGRVKALLRTPIETPGFGIGDRVRLLGLAYGRDDDAGSTILTMTKASEVFELKGHT